MNKQEIEKLFDEKFNFEGVFGKNSDAENDIKQFIFETVIPEVLRGVKIEKKLPDNDVFVKIINKYIEDKAKELFNIDL